ncbi:teicoplanin resistance protein VanZ [Pseudomonas taiwanensis]|uniref:VanZ family protein n=1 Tax=Pseudomonas taiwanensis TaxID=470150 RepID=UPI0015BA7D87|nr:VanZ family protein [Pseudomonas taiwanensis]NWL79038.1 teicoplanin resistance protein VanZ [Pseudomonas taiwanensis]
MTDIRITWLARITFGLVLLVILVAGLSSEPVPEAFDNQDKLHHWAGFACLALSASLAFPSTRLVWLFIWTLLVSMGIELGQALLPLRTASWADIAANVLGVLSGSFAALLLREKGMPTHLE